MENQYEISEIAKDLVQYISPLKRNTSQEKLFDNCYSSYQSPEKLSPVTLKK